MEKRVINIISSAITLTLTLTLTSRFPHQNKHSDFPTRLSSLTHETKLTQIHPTRLSSLRLTPRD